MKSYSSIPWSGRFRPTRGRIVDDDDSEGFEQQGLYEIIPRMRFGLCGPCEMPASFMFKFAMMIIISNLVRQN